MARVSASQKELTAYAKAMQAAGIGAWTLEREEPDGTRIRLAVGVNPAQASRSNIDKMLGITNG